MKHLLKDAKALEHMRASGRLVAQAFELLRANIKPGVTLAMLDRLVEDFIRQNGAQTLYKGYQGSANEHPPFPGAICASVNQEICHGIPDQRTLHEGDLVGIDIGLRLNGYCGDACVTFPVGHISAEANRLLEVTQECLRRGVHAARARRPVTDIGAAIESYANSQGMTVVREWGGHGLGRDLHEPPSISHVRERRRGPKLRPGMTFTIEPMINAGEQDWRLLDDGWTVVTADGKLSAQFEHAIAILDDRTEILTRL
ncbi:MAG: type I methionyl aminopeptidase [Anaerolineales bacterium]